MAALTDLSDLINRQTGGNNGSPENIFFHKTPRFGGIQVPTPSVGRGASLWTNDGVPASGAVPTSAAIPTNSTQGAIKFTPPGGTREKWLIGAAVAPTVAGVYLLYDRLFHIGGLSGTSTSDQTIQGSTPSPALTRNTGGAGNMIFSEIYTAVGTTQVSLIATYTDQDGNTGQTTTTQSFGGTGFRDITRMQRLPLAAGDTGVRAVEKITLSATTGTTGNFGIIIAQPLAWIPVGAIGTMGWRDYTTGLPGIPSIDPDACLALMYIPSIATSTELFGSLAFVEK
jgi:hypothetical protein